MTKRTNNDFPLKTKENVDQTFSIKKSSPSKSNFAGGDPSIKSFTSPFSSWKTRGSPSFLSLVSRPYLQHPMFFPNSLTRISIVSPPVLEQGILYSVPNTVTPSLHLDRPWNVNLFMRRIKFLMKGKK